MAKDKRLDDAVKELEAERLRLRTLVRSESKNIVVMRHTGATAIDIERVVIRERQAKAALRKVSAELSLLRDVVLSGT